MGAFRLLLALVVLDSHFGFLPLPVVRGHDAVEAFFVVSGFFMALVLEGVYGVPGGRRVFLANRALRIFPPYLAMLALSLALFLCLGLHPLATPWDYERAMAAPGAGPLLALLQAGLVGQEWLFVLGADPAGGLVYLAHGGANLWRMLLVPQAWSLSLELCFYCLAPWLALRRPRTLVTLLLASLGLRLGASLLGWEQAAIFWKRFFPAELWLFLTGMLSYRLYRRWFGQQALEGRDSPCSVKGLVRACPRVTTLLLAGLPLLGLTALVLWGKLVPPPWRTLAIAGALLAAMPPLFARFGGSRTDRLLGDLSYPFYPTHMLVIAMIEELASEHPDPTAWWPVAVLGSLGLALALHFTVERPVNRLRRRLARRGLPEAGLSEQAPA